MSSQSPRPHAQPRGRDRRVERISWYLGLAIIALGAVALGASFRDSDAAVASAAEAASDTGDQADAVAGSDGSGEVADATNGGRADRFTVSASGDILIHERVADAATTSDGFDFAPLFAPVQNLIASRDFSICHLEVPISSTNQDLAYTEGVFRAPMQLAVCTTGRRLVVAIVNGSTSSAWL